MYWRLLSSDPEAARAVVLSDKPEVRTVPYSTVTYHTISHLISITLFAFPFYRFSFFELFTHFLTFLFPFTIYCFSAYCRSIFFTHSYYLTNIYSSWLPSDRWRHLSVRAITPWRPHCSNRHPSIHLSQTRWEHQNRKFEPHFLFWFSVSSSQLYFALWTYDIVPKWRFCVLKKNDWDIFKISSRYK